MTDRAPRDGGARPGPRKKPVPAARRTGPAAPALLQLQAAAGNAAVSGLLARSAAAPVESTPATVQRQVPTCPAPPVTPPGTTPAADPRFAALKSDLAGTARAARAHPPATTEVKQAQDAAIAPADDREAQARAAQTGKMAAAKPAGFDKAGFIAAVNAAVAKQAPRNLDEADSFATSGRADQVKSEVLGKVTQGKDQSGQDIAERTREAPDLGKTTEKPVTPLPPAPPTPRLAPPDPRRATPERAPAEQTDLRAEQCETHGAMAQAGVSDDQLAHAGEPQFTDALAAKKEGEQHTATAPAAVRATEAQQLSATTAAADASGKAAVATMVGAHKLTGQKGDTAKAATKSKDEQDRARITAEIKGIFDATKTDVEKILSGIDDQVTKRFEEGEAKAKAAFTADHQARMRRYKDQRYSGLLGAGRWLKDLVADLPAEANNLFLESKKLYESRMQAVIADIADFVGAELGRAKDRIALGRDQVAKKVADQPVALRKIAGEAAADFQTQFAELDEAVVAKQQAVVDDLAAKYVEARNAVDEEIKKLQEANKGLWSKAKDAVVGAIETILKLKDMLLGVLARAAGAIELIIKDPIGFLGNMVNAVKTGVMNFGANILKHLTDGLKSWLLGNLANAGVEIPDTFDVRGILKLVLSMLGLTWASVRTRILRFIPEPVLAVLEKSVAVVSILVTEGLPGLWKWVLEKVGDLKEMVLGQVKEFVVEKIVKSGLTWLVSLLNPAAAFIKACKAIYDIVMFFVDKAAQVKEFVDTVLDSVESIARGGVGAVADLIEKALAKAVPLVLGMLASLLGLGGISEKIKSIIEKIATPVNKVVDSVVGTVVKAGKGMLAKLRKKVRGGDDSPQGKQQRLEQGVKAGVAATNRFAGRAVGQKLLKPLLGGIRHRYGLSVMEPVRQDRYWAVHATVSRMTEPTRVEVELDMENVKTLTQARQSSNNLLKKETTAQVARVAKNRDKLGAEAKAKLTAIQARLAAVTAEHEAAYAESDRISRDRKGDPARVAALITLHGSVKTRCEAIGEELKDLTRGPEELQQEADTAFRGIETSLATATETLADAKVKQFVVEDPFQAGLGKDLKARIDAMTTSLAGAKRSVTSVAELDVVRALKRQADELGVVAARARSMSNASHRVDLIRKTIDNVLKKTTNYGTIGNRTTEAALVWEAENGEPWMSATGHLIEVKEMKAALENAMKELDFLKAGERGVRAKADAELDRARKRIVGFDQGLAAWDNRKSRFPAVWDENGQSLKKPGWPAR